MAPPAGTLRVWRYFVALIALIAVLYLIVFWPGARHTPKLGLDLRGGTQVIFTAKTTDGKTPTASSMQQAKQIMTDRVNGSGVTQATVVIQGSNQLVVSVPGSTNTDVAKLGAAAKLNFRGLVAPAAYVTCAPVATSSPSGSGTATPSGASTGSPAPSATTQTSRAANAPARSSAASPNDAGHAAIGNPLAAATPSTGPSAPTPSTTPTASRTPTPTAASSSAAAAPPCTATPFAGLDKAGAKIPLTEPDWDKLDARTKSSISAALANFDCSSAQDEKDLADSYYVVCGAATQGVAAFLLGPVIVPGTQIKSAVAQSPNISQGQSQWAVVLDMRSSGSAAWAKYTSAHNTGGDTSNTADVLTCGASSVPCADFVGITLDGVIVSSPVNNAAINGGQTQITGSFTSSTAHDLANKLKYGALPLTFKAETAETISATLGTSQLKSGLLAGGIGLILVVLYSLIYYRALGLVTIASLIVSGILTYGCLVMLGTQIDLTLSLAGIAGFIVAVGITADSFVVFFERIKDEVHEGRSARVAIPRAWIRARRTIISADVVSFLAAAILYYFAAGDVKGFAFTLGLSTILDLATVFLFTHPLISLFSRSRAFGSRRFTGLDSLRAHGTGTGLATATIEQDVLLVGSSGETAAERAAARRERLRREAGEL